MPFPASFTHISVPVPKSALCLFFLSFFLISLFELEYAHCSNYNTKLICEGIMAYICRYIHNFIQHISYKPFSFSYAYIRFEAKHRYKLFPSYKEKIGLLSHFWSGIGLKTFFIKENPGQKETMHHLACPSNLFLLLLSRRGGWGVFHFFL